jgi:hypothetical protein
VQAGGCYAGETSKPVQVWCRKATSHDEVVTPELLNSVRECSKAMKTSAFAHLKTMYRIMNYCVVTPNRGLLLKPKGTWDGNKDYEFEIEGYPDALEPWIA